MGQAAFASSHAAGSPLTSPYSNMSSSFFPISIHSSSVVKGFVAMMQHWSPGLVRSAKLTS